LQRLVVKNVGKDVLNNTQKLLPRWSIIHAFNRKRARRAPCRAE
jgi:hypothetical protein